MPYYTGLDIGGSHARILLADKNGAKLCEFTGAGGTFNVVGPKRAAHAYTALVRHAMEQTGFTPAGCAGLCAAVSGVDSPGLAAECKGLFTRMGFAPDKTHVVNDCEIYLYTIDGPAIVLTVGTGSIAVGRGADGRVHRCGGWGHILSDEGSGFAMGLAVLRAVGNHLDGRQPCPVLHQLFTQASPLRTTLALNQFAADNMAMKKPVAALAPLLDAAARQGDVVATGLLAQSAEQLYSLVADLHQKLRLPDGQKPAVLLWGSVLLHSQHISAAVRGQIRERLGVKAYYPDSRALQIALETAMKL